MAAAFSADTATRALDDQARDLWTYLHPNRRHFSLAAAREVLGALDIGVGDSVNEVARRLAHALRSRNIALQHHAALEASARVLGYASYQDARRNASNSRLEAHLFTSMTGVEQVSHNVATWRELAEPLCAACERISETQTIRVFQLEVGVRHLTVWSLLSDPNSTDSRMMRSPLGSVRPVAADDDDWLDGAPAVIETLRRRLEETGKAVLDGAAVFEHGSDRQPSPSGHLPALASDLANAELVLLRADDDETSGFEIARGDEVNCWSEFDVARDGAEPRFSEDDGAWYAGNGRYVWEFELLRPADYIPGRIVRAGRFEVSKRLFRRYQLAQRIFSGVAEKVAASLREPKSMAHFRDLPETVRVNKHAVLLALSRAGHTWESFWQGMDEKPKLDDVMSTQSVFSIVHELKLERPGDLLVPPHPSELALLEDAGLLRALLERIQHVRYRLPDGLAADAAAEAREAIREFGEALNMWQFMKANDPERHLAWLSHADEATTLYQRLTALGLRIRAGATFNLFSTAGLPLPEHIDRSQFAPFGSGYSLFLHLELARYD